MIRPWDYYKFMTQFYPVLLFLSLLVSLLSAGSLFAEEVQKIKKLSPEEEAERAMRL